MAITVLGIDILEMNLHLHYNTPSQMNIVQKHGGYCYIKITKISQSRHFFDNWRRLVPTKQSQETYSVHKWAGLIKPKYIKRSAALRTAAYWGPVR